MENEADYRLRGRRLEHLTDEALNRRWLKYHRDTEKVPGHVRDHDARAVLGPWWRRTDRQAPGPGGRARPASWRRSVLDLGRRSLGSGGQGARRNTHRERLLACGRSVLPRLDRLERR